MNKRVLILLVPLLILAGVFAASNVVPPAHAVIGKTTVCTAPMDASTLAPIGPCLVVGVTGATVANSTGYSPFTGPITSPATQLVVGVWVNNSDSFLGFDITLKASPVNLTPADADLVGTMLASPTVFVKCIGGLLRSASGLCQPTDTSDTIHFSAGTGVFAAGTGLLFRSIWNITGVNPALAVPAIHFQFGCGSSTVPTSIGPAPNVCITLLSGTPSTPVPSTFDTISFDDSNQAAVPFVSVSAPTINFGTRAVGDTTVTETLTYSANTLISATGEPAALTAITASFLHATPTCSATITPATVTPLPGSIATATLTISAVGAGLGAGPCGVTVSGSYVIGSAEFLPVTSSLVVPVTVSVNYVDFSLAASPTTVNFLTTGSGTTAVTVGSLNNFAGSVTLSTFSLVAGAPTGMFVPNPVVVPAGGSVGSAGTISGGAAGTTYVVQLRGQTVVAGFTRLKIVTLSVTVQDFGLTYSGPGLVTLVSGGAGNSTTFTVSSKPATVNGLAGTVTITNSVNATGLSTLTCPPTVTLPAGATSPPQTCTINSSTPGSYNVTITGSFTGSGVTITHKISFKVLVKSVVVTKDPTSTTISCTLASTFVGQSSSCTATVKDTAATGATTPTGTVSFSLLSTSTATGSFGTPTCMLATFNTTTATCMDGFTGASPGNANVNATYSGDTGHTISQGRLTIIVSKATPTVTTSLLPTSITVGQRAMDNATVTGGFSPTGTVTFRVFTGSVCTGTPIATRTGPLVGTLAGPVSVTINATGTFQWQATYNGDANNNVASSTCGSESLSVTPATPTVTTSLSTTSVVVGNAVTDTATVSAGFNSTGTVTFRVFTGNLCTGTAIATRTASLVGTTAGPVSVTINATGTFQWQATYNGDSNNNGASSACGTETLMVTRASPTITTSLSATTVVVGGSVFDTATLGGGFQAGGSVAYNLFNSATCTGTSTLVSMVTVTNGVVPDSAPQVFNTAGSFGWNATYSGDANNKPASSGCEPLTVSAVIVVGDFSVSVNPPRPSLAPGSARNVTVVIHSLNFTGTVTLTVAISPIVVNGPTGVFSRSSITLAVNASSISKLRLATSASTPAGTYTVTVTAMSDGLSHSNATTLTVKGFNKTTISDRDGTASDDHMIGVTDEGHGLGRFSDVFFITAHMPEDRQEFELS